MTPTSVTIKLYPLEYYSLYLFLHKFCQNAEDLGINCTVPGMVLADLFRRKQNTILLNAHSKKGKPRSLTLKPIQARALYDELRLYSYSDVIIGQIFGHLDRSLKNLNFSPL